MNKFQGNLARSTIFQIAETKYFGTLPEGQMGKGGLSDPLLIPRRISDFALIIDLDLCPRDDEWKEN